MNAARSFLGKHLLWGSQIVAELSDCKELKVKNALVFTCRRKITDARIKHNFIRFFMNKQIGQTEITRIVANWRDITHLPAFSLSKNQALAVITARYPKSKLGGLPEKIIVYDRKLKKLRASWEGTMEGPLPKRYTLFDDSKKITLLNNYNLQTCPNYIRQARVHAFIPTNISTKRATSKCLLPNAQVYESYNPSTCLCGCSGTYNSTTTTATGNVNFTLNSSCTSGPLACDAANILFHPSGSLTTCTQPALFSSVSYAVAPALVGNSWDVSCDGSSPSASCLCPPQTTSNPFPPCSATGVAFDTYYHINYMLNFAVNDLYYGSPGHIEFETNNSSNVSCGKWSNNLLSVSVERNDCFGVPGSETPNEWNYGTTYHEVMHAIATRWGISGGGNRKLPYDTEGSAMEEGRANYVGTALSHFTRFHAVTDFGSFRYRRYPKDFNCLANCPCGTSECPSGSGFFCTSHKNGEIWENAFMKLELLAGKKRTVDMVMGFGFFTDTYNSSFVRLDQDLGSSSCAGSFSCGLILSGGSSSSNNSISHYQAMLQANFAWYDGLYTTEIWKAFNKMMSTVPNQPIGGNPQQPAIQTCLEPQDDYGNMSGSAYLVDLDNGGTFVNGHPEPGWGSRALAIDYPKDVDYFFFYLPKEQTVRILGDPNQMELTVTVFQPDGTQLPSGSSQTGTTINLDVTSVVGGWHAVKVNQPSSQTGTYTISFHKVSLDREPNDINGDAIPIRIDSTTKSASLDTLTDQDTFRFFTTAPTTSISAITQDYTITLTPDFGLTARLTVYDQSSSVLGQVTSNTNGTPANLTINHVAGQWIYVKIDSPNQGIGNYTLKVQASQEDTNIQFAGYTLSNGTAILLDTKTFLGALELEATGPNSRFVAKMPDADPRYYRVFADKHDQIVVETSDLTGSVDTVLRVYPEPFGANHPKPGLQGLLVTHSGLLGRKVMDTETNRRAFIQEDDDGAIIPLASRVQFIAPRTGWYFISVTPFGASSIGGSYQINVRKRSTSSISALPTHSCH